MYPQFPAWDVGNSHLLGFSPLCVFKCLHKELVSEQAKSHWLHLFDFSPLCVFKCVLKASAGDDAKSHWLQLCAALCAHNCVKKLWSDHLALTRVGIEKKQQQKQNKKTAKQQNNNNNKRTTTKQQQQNNNNKTTKTKQKQTITNNNNNNKKTRYSTKTTFVKNCVRHCWKRLCHGRSYVTTMSQSVSKVGIL